MSKSSAKRSKAAEGSSTSRSVLDFLYNDSRRIGSFLSQFEVGHLQQLTQTTDSEQGRQHGTKTQGKLGVPGVAGGSMAHEQQTSLAASEGLTRVFDPYWSNARAFLNYLSENDLLQLDITKATMGQFVEVTGSLIIADNAMFRFMWENPSIRSFMKNQFLAATEAAQQQQQQPQPNRQERRKQGHVAKPKSEAEQQADLVLELIPHMPHSGHIHIVTDELGVWASAADGALVTPMADLVLKHGPKIAGQWSMVGILDAYPFDATQMEQHLMTGMEMARVGMGIENLSKVALQMEWPIRQALGRPLLSYGMTPLLVYRKLSG